MTKLKWTLLFLGLFAVLGYCREFFFVHLNILMYEKYYHSISPLPFPPIMNYFRRFSYDTLYYSKYLYTFLWTAAFFFANYFTVKKLTKKPALSKILIYSYVCMLGLAAFTMIYGYFINGRLQDEEYTLSRWLMGIAQSPIICLILVASEKLYNQSFHHD